jgi:hypothetical protein
VEDHSGSSSLPHFNGLSVLLEGWLWWIASPPPRGRRSASGGADGRAAPRQFATRITSQGALYWSGLTDQLSASAIARDSV